MRDDVPQEFCPSCGNGRIGVLRFCRSCGFDFGNDESLAPPKGVPSQALSHESEAAETTSAESIAMPLSRQPEGSGLSRSAVVRPPDAGPQLTPGWTWTVRKSSGGAFKTGERIEIAFGAREVRIRGAAGVERLWPLSQVAFERWSKDGGQLLLAEGSKSSASEVVVEVEGTEDVGAFQATLYAAQHSRTEHSAEARHMEEPDLTEIPVFQGDVDCPRGLHPELVRKVSALASDRPEWQLPPEPVYESPWGLVSIGWLVFMGIYFVFGLPGNLQRNPDQAVGLVIGTILLFVAPVVVWKLVSARNRRMSWARAHPEWVRTKERWQRMYYCTKDDLAFIPTEDGYLIAEEV